MIAAMLRLLADHMQPGAAAGGNEPVFERGPLKGSWGGDTHRYMRQEGINKLKHADPTSDEPYRGESDDSIRRRQMKETQDISDVVPRRGQ